MLYWRILVRFRKRHSGGFSRYGKEKNTEKVTKGAQNRERLLRAVFEARKARKIEKK
jgi:hypothetical protein